MSQRFVRAGVLALLLVLPLGRAAAQAGPGLEPVRPIIVVSANAEVDVAPDRAHLSVAVESRGRTAAEASAASARLKIAVLDAIPRAWIPAAQIQTTAISVAPEYEYPREGGRPTLVGYQARNSVEVEVRDLTVIGAVLDAVLAAGATNVAGPRFAIADASSARRAALELAVRKAHADAEAIAAAAGVSLGGVLEIISADQGEVAPMMEFTRARLTASASADVGTPVESGRITVRASVSVRYAIRQ